MNLKGENYIKGALSRGNTRNPSETHRANDKNGKDHNYAVI